MKYEQILDLLEDQNLLDCTLDSNSRYKILLDTDSVFSYFTTIDNDLFDLLLKPNNHLHLLQQQNSFIG